MPPRPVQIRVLHTVQRNVLSISRRINILRKTAVRALVFSPRQEYRPAKRLIDALKMDELVRHLAITGLLGSRAATNDQLRGPGEEQRHRQLLVLSTGEAVIGSGREIRGPERRLQACLNNSPAEISSLLRVRDARCQGIATATVGRKMGGKNEPVRGCLDSARRTFINADSEMGRSSWPPSAQRGRARVSAAKTRSFFSPQSKCQNGGPMFLTKT